MVTSMSSRLIRPLRASAEYAGLRRALRVTCVMHWPYWLARSRAVRNLGAIVSHNTKDEQAPKKQQRSISRRPSRRCSGPVGTILQTDRLSHQAWERAVTALVA
jgi:hypothetical protein